MQVGVQAFAGQRLQAAAQVARTSRHRRLRVLQQFRQEGERLSAQELAQGLWGLAPQGSDEHVMATLG